MRRIGWIVLGIVSVALVILAMGSLARTSHRSAKPAPSHLQPDQRLPSSSEPAPAKPDPKVLMARADRAGIEGDYAKARQLYREVLELTTDPEMAAIAQERLGKVNIQLLLSPGAKMEGQAEGAAGERRHHVQPGDTLFKIAKSYGVTVELIKAANGLKGDLIRVNQMLRIPQVNFSVIVDKSQNTLTLKNGEEVVKVYRCSTGASDLTPIGRFRIVSRLKDPAWRGVIPPGDPKNPLGSRWLGFDLPQYGIHGTNEPDTIGKPVTQGCIRMLNSDVEELFDLLPEGTPVEVVE